MKTNTKLKSIKRKESFWKLFYATFKEQKEFFWELYYDIFKKQIMIAIGCVIQISLFSGFFYVLCKIYGEENFFASSILAILAMTVEIVGILLIWTVIKLLHMCYRSLSLINRLTYIPLTFEEMKAVGIDVDSNKGIEKIVAEIIYFLAENILCEKTIEEAYEGRWIFSNVKFAFYNKCEEIKSLIPYMEIIKNLANYDELQEIVSLPINDENKETIIEKITEFLHNENKNDHSIG